MRSLAAFIAEHDPDIFAVHAIDAGDALIVATRFDREWGYRGGQALFWKPPYAANAVRDRYLPSTGLLPFDRRGLLEVDGELDGTACTLYALEFSRARATQLAELRFARETVGRGGNALLFVARPHERFGFGDRGFDFAAGDARLQCFVRGFSATQPRTNPTPDFPAILTHITPTSSP